MNLPTPSWLLALALLAAPAVAQEARAPEFSGSYDPGQASDGLTDAQHAAVQREIDANVADLQARGLIGAAGGAAGAPVVALGWPLRSAPGRAVPGYHGLSNFVDQSGPGVLGDYQCGTRTYDGHRGVDVFTWPFSWSVMDAGDVEVVAGAPGVVVARRDGEFDRSCVTNQNIWNAVYIRHADGSVAWYGHLKNGSVTPRVVGESVAAGEVLGVVGSSGNSTGPHLHLELYGPGNVLVDPYVGQCNPTTAASWWAEQRPYYDSAVNALHTHSAWPVLAQCPGTVDQPNLDDTFAPGEVVRVVAYYRDQLQGQTTTYALVRPDGTVYSQWTHASPAAHYAASYWGWSSTLPADAPMGAWTFRTTYLGETTEHTFTVAPPVAAEGTGAGAAPSLSAPRPNPVRESATLVLVLPEPGAVRADVYDAFGRHVAVLHDGALGAGTHALRLDAAALPSGTYVVRLAAGGETAVRRVTVVR